jgi:signal transduction histidine kinase
MSRGTVLIVDDEESVLVSMAAILELEGYAVETTTSGRRALERLRQKHFDVVLTDLRLDDLDGLTILAEVRKTSPETAGIVLTGYASLESAVKALREGAYDYLIKPCEVEELKVTVARGVERRQLALALQQRVRELEEANGLIRKLNEELQARVEEATAQLQQRVRELARARDEISALHRAAEAHVRQLEELDRLKSQFLSMASHELRTPLTAISGFIQLALRRARQRFARGMPSPAEWHEEQLAHIRQLEMVTSQTFKLSRLVDELLDVSRIESGKFELRLNTIDLARLAAEVVERMQQMTRKHRLVLEVLPSGQAAGGARLAGGRSAAVPEREPATLPAGPSQPPPLMITADRDYLEQVLENLIGNAIKYSPDGGSVTITLQPQDDHLLLSVRDQGMGIPRDEQAMVFDLFYRSRSATAQQTGGMGLGLYISREIVRRHGGRIWVESAPGKGSTFFVALPRCATPPPAQPKAVASSLPAR